MSSIVAIAGGSGGLGRAIVDALKESGRYTPLVLSRKADPEVEKKVGARIVEVDYSNVDALAKAFEDNKIDTVINSLGVVHDPAPMFNLIEAADKSKTTSRFIPNFFSALLYQTEHRSISPLVEGRMAQYDSLKKTSLQWTSIYNGLFLEYMVPNIPTYTNSIPFFVDVEANAAAIPGSGDYPVHYTYTRDIGRYIAALLGLEKWEEKYFIAGDTKTLHEVVTLAERVKGTKFDVKYDSIEKLEGGEYTELPGYEKAYAYLGAVEVAKPMMAQMMIFFATLFAKGHASFGPGSYLNEIFPEIKPMSFEEALKKSFQK